MSHYDGMTEAALRAELEDARLEIAELQATVERLQTWHESDKEPTEKGWYLCRATDDRWRGGMNYRAWGNGSWWIPLKDGWFSSPMGLYEWLGPVANIDGPAPDGTNPQPIKAAEAAEKDGE